MLNFNFKTLPSEFVVHTTSMLNFSSITLACITLYEQYGSFILDKRNYSMTKINILEQKTNRLTLGDGHVFLFYDFFHQLFTLQVRYLA